MSQENQALLAATHVLHGPGQDTSCPNSSMGCLLSGQCLCSRGWLQQIEEGSLLKPWSRGTDLPYLADLEEASPPLGGGHKPNTSS